MESWSPAGLLSLKSLHLSNARIASVNHHVCFSALFPSFDETRWQSRARVRLLPLPVSGRPW